MNQKQNVLLEFQNVSKFYIGEKLHKVQALENITFSINQGDFISLIGPSGCGKSTLLRLAAGLEKSSFGEVLYRGNRINRPDRQRGFVFQSYSAFPWLTVRQNIAFGLDNSDPHLNNQKVYKWLNFTGLTEFADSYPKVLSGGMRQRLAIARSMVVEPELLLLDEPFGALDEKTRESMRTLLLKVVIDSGCTVLFVSHDIREAISLADRIVLFSTRPGRILNIYVSPFNQPRSRPREYLKTPEFNSLYEEILDSFPS